MRGRACRQAGGTAPYTFAVTAGALPVGLSLSSGGALTGTPTAAGTFNFTVTATDSSTGTGPYAGTQSYSMTIAPPTIAVSPASLAAGTVGLAYSQTVTASGGTAGYTFAVTSGPLPAGLTLSTGGVLSGTPTAGGSFNITITATDSTPGGSGGPFTSSANYTLTINAPTITVSPGVVRRDVRDGVCGGEPVGKWWYGPLHVRGDGGCSAGRSEPVFGRCADGHADGCGHVQLHGDGNRQLTGTGPYAGTQSYSMTIAPPTIAVSPASLAAGTVGLAYSQTVTA